MLVLAIGIAFVFIALPILIRTSRTPLPFVLFSALYLFPLLNFPSPMDTRLLALGVAASQLPYAIKTGKLTWKGSSLAPILVISSYGALSLVSFTWSIDPQSTLSATVGTILTLVGVLIFSSTLSHRVILRVTLVFLLVVCGISLLAGLITPNFAIEAGRLRGVLGNANGLGVLAAFGALLSASARRNIPLVTFFVGVLLLTGSRGSLLAAAAGLLVFALLPAPSRKIGPGPSAFFIACAGVGMSVLYFTLKPDWSIFRTNDSRTEVWRGLIPYVEAYWPFGSGAGTLEQFSTNSLLKSVSELGFVGLILVCAYLCTLALAAKGSRAQLSVWTMGAFATTVESWLLAGGSYYSFLFLAILARSEVPVLTQNLPAKSSSATHRGPHR